MAKIIKVENEIVSLGMPDGSIKDVKVMALDFEPVVGAEVDVFGTDENLIVVLKKKPASQGKVLVNKLVYALLAFFLGGLGAHKFYAGKIGLGILYLVFFWTFIPGIIAFIEFIIALTKTADADGNIEV